MKIFYLILALIAAAGVKADECAPHSNLGLPKADQVLCREGYVVGYSYAHKQPVYTVSHYSRWSVSQFLKRSNDFREDKDVPAPYRSTIDDYRGSGYDRGHLAPNAALDWSKNAMSESFLLSNISPQRPGFNRSGNKNLEKDIRLCAKQKKRLQVITGPIYSKGREVKKIGNGVSVPHGYFKIVFTKNATTGKAEAFGVFLPHIDFKNINGSNFVSVNDIEAHTGLDFLANLPDDIEDRIEQNSEPFCSSMNK